MRRARRTFCRGLWWWWWSQVLDYEDNLRDSLYVKPQKPKGNTAGRARTQSYAGALMQA